MHWYLRYSLSYRDLAEMMAERGLHGDHTIIYRWVQRYAPDLEKRAQAQWRATNDSWRVAETYIKVYEEWADRDQAVDSAGNTLDCVRSPFRYAQAAEYSFRQLLGDGHTVRPRAINGDQNAAYPPAFKARQAEGQHPPECSC